MANHQVNSVMRSAPASSTLYDVLDLILDKGLVVDVYARISVIGIEVITIDARIVIASVDTYLRFAEAVNRLDIEARKTSLFGGEERGPKKEQVQQQPQQQQQPQRQPQQQPQQQQQQQQQQGEQR
jgi:hypothetical protein